MLDFSTHNHLANSDRTWEEFVRADNLDHQNIRPVIASSWERCRDNQINPFDKYYSEILHEDELRGRLESCHNLIRGTVPFMRMLLETCGEDLNAILSDSEGYVLELIGKPEVLSMSKQFGVVKGANISEKVAGTSTAGTVLVEQKPLQVLAHEHYCQAFHGISCSAAPIFDPFGKLIGVLNISGVHNKFHPSNTLGLVVAAAKAIGNQLQLGKVCDELKQANYFSKTMMESVSEGLITVNYKGEVLWINTVAGRILGLEPAKKIGLQLDELDNSLLPMQKIFHNGQFFDQVIVLEISRGSLRFTISTQPIKSGNGQIIGAVLTLKELQTVQSVLKNIAAKTRFTFESLIGEDEAFQAAVSLARKASVSSSTVLLQGESGTGKELFAQAIHSAGIRARGPFIAVNCGTIPRELVESELFGYEDGAFTGAKSGGSPGKFELASGGTIFLDEIGDMPYELQVSLLRCLQEKQVTRLGGRKAIAVDVRVIAATHRDLWKEIAKGNFREDLYYRLDIINIKIPPLRERQRDIPMLAAYLARKIGARLGKKSVEISEEAMNSIIAYTWRGNVRELENALERAINVAPGSQILLEHLPETLAGTGRISPLPNIATDLLSLEEIERTAIMSTIQSLKGNIAQASRVLGVSRNTLYNKIKQYCIRV